MGSNQAEMRFIRIRGRVIPIRRKNVEGSAAIAGGAGVVLSAQHLTSSSAYNKRLSAVVTESFQSSNHLSRKTFVTTDFRTGHARAQRFERVASKFYGREMKASGAELAPILFDRSFSDRFVVMKSGARKIQVKGRDLPAFLHELGHAQQFENATVLNRARYALSKVDFGDKVLAVNEKLARFATNNRIRLSEKAWMRIEKGFEAVAVKARVPSATVTLLHEADAWRRAYRLAGRPSLRRAVVKASINPLRSYALFPAHQIARIGLIAGGVAIAAYGISKTLRKNESRK